MFTFEYANTPVYGDDTENCIVLNVKWQEFNEEHPFSATSYDSMPHSVELFNRAKAGEFGAIAAYVPLVTQTPTQPNTTGSQTL
jgi:hypothetical protein